MAVEVLHPDQTIDVGYWTTNWHLLVDEDVAEWATHGGYFPIKHGPEFAGFTAILGFPVPSMPLVDIARIRIRYAAQIDPDDPGTANCVVWLSLYNGATFIGGDVGVVDSEGVTIYTSDHSNVGNGPPYGSVSDLRLWVMSDADTAYRNGRLHAVELLIEDAEGGGDDTADYAAYLHLPPILMQHAVPQRKRLQLYPW